MSSEIKAPGDELEILETSKSLRERKEREEDINKELMLNVSDNVMYHVLHRVALCCTVLHCVALCCTVLHCVALCSN